MVMARSFTMPFGGVKLIAADLFRTFKRAGVSVTLVTERSDDEMRAIFPDVDSIISYFQDLRPLMGRHFDLVMTHGWSSGGLALLECQITFRYLVLCSYSSFVPGEVIYAFDEQADAVMFESEHNLETQSPSLEQSPAPQISLRNALATEWFSPPPPRHHHPAPARIRIVSNHKAPEMLELPERLTASGADVEWVGRNGEIRLVDAELVDGCDVVVSIGATIQKALLRGVPVFCYDHFGGPGYITRDTFDRAEHFNFSGRCTYNRRDAATLCDEIVEGYARAAAEAHDLRAKALARYCMPERLSAMIELFTDRDQPRSFAAGKYDNLRRLLHSNLNNYFPTPIFGVSYMVGSRRPSLRMIDIRISEQPEIDSVKLNDTSPFLFLGDQETPVRMRLVARLHGELDIRQIAIREAPAVQTISTLQTRFVLRDNVTEVRASFSYAVTTKTQMFRVMVQADARAPIELFRIRLLQ